MKSSYWKIGFVILLVIALIYCMDIAAATEKPKPPGRQDNSQIVNTEAVANAGAIAKGGAGGNAVATGGAGGDAVAKGGDAVATGGNAVSEGGNSLAYAIVDGGAGGSVGDIEVSYVQARSAPSMGQGSFAITGCSVGGNAGGSNTSGSAFLGFGWTPLECYKFMLAQAYQAIGEKQAVCDILRKTKAGEALIKEGVELPTCEPEIVITANCNTEGCAEAAKAAAEAAMDERLDRMRKVWQENVK